MSVATLKHSVPLLVMQFKQKQQTEGWYEYFRDDFDDDVIGAEWIPHNTDVNRTIVEESDLLTIAIANNANADWWYDPVGIQLNDAPKIYMEIPTPPVEIITKLNSYTVNDLTHAGMFVASDAEGITLDGAYLHGRLRNDGTGRNGLVTTRTTPVVPYRSYVAVVAMPIWLKAYIPSVSNSDVLFSYSTDGINWTLLHTATAYYQPGYYVGLFAKNWAATWSNIAAPFEFFEINVFEKRRLTVAHGYAPIDVRSDTAFYEGRIKQMSPLRRAVDDRTGLFQVADMSLTLANHDMEFSKLLTSHILKNQEVAVYHAWTDKRETEKSHICTMIVEDHSLKGTHFNLKLKDITKKYFTKKVPLEICTEEEFPLIYPDHIGRRMPEVLGFAEIGTEFEHPGAVEAIYINTTTFRYLAAAGTLVGVPAVYSNDAPQATPGDYSIVYAGGRTYIDFVNTQGDNTVAFNCYGYSVPAWDSTTNNCIQNLAYIIEYYLRFLMGIPASMIKDVAFDTLATYFVNLGVDEDCYLILQDESDADEILRQLLFTGGAKGFIAKDGEFTVERKDVHNYEITSLDSHLLSQIELFAAPDRQWNLLNAINTIKARYGYIPWQRLFKSAEETYRDNFYDEIMEDDIKLPRENLPV